MDRRVKFYIIGSGTALIVLILTVMYGLTVRQGRLIERQTYERASSVFDEIILMRRWNSDHGGVFVLKRPGEVSNQYLKNPDITDSTGKVYTIKNPATMTREVSEYSEKGGNFTFHITALKLRNPNNKPDDWERASLMSFERGSKEATEVVMDRGRRVFRLMRPLYVEESCIPCHADQGYKLGDVRGGISVTLPYDDMHAALRSNFLGMAGMTALLVAVITVVFYFVIWRLMDRLGRQKKELEVLNETKDRFLGIAAHDLRNPLVVVDGYAELLAGVSTDEQQLDLVRGIKGATAKMLGLINNLLDVSKIKSGKLELKPQEHDVREFISECAFANEMISRKKDIELDVSVPEDIGQASFDKERMHQALDNLLSNAFKYSRPGTKVVLGAQREGSQLRVWVEDNGVGIKEDELPGIFDEFARTSARPTAGETSHGLGLAIAKRVVELHGGKIEAKSAQGAGTTITITLPLKS